MRNEPSNGVVVTVTATSVISSRNCIVTLLSLTPAAAACTVSLYDPPYAPTAPGAAPTLTTTGATLRVTLSAPASVGSVSVPCSASGIEFANGCIAVVTGVAATANVGFQVI